MTLGGVIKVSTQKPTNAGFCVRKWVANYL